MNRSIFDANTRRITSPYPNMTIIHQNGGSIGGGSATSYADLGICPIEYGGTGAETADLALANLGVIQEFGTFTPKPGAREGTAPSSYNTDFSYGYYFRIGQLVYISFYCQWNIVSTGNGNACVNGLPYTSGSMVGNQALTLNWNSNFVGSPNFRAVIDDQSSYARLIQNTGEYAYAKWQTGDTIVAFSGCYIKN